MGKKLVKNLQIREIVMEEIYKLDTEHDKSALPFKDIPFHKRLTYVTQAEKFFKILKVAKKEATKKGLIESKL